MGLDHFAPHRDNGKIISGSQSVDATRTQEHILNRCALFILRGTRPLLGQAACKYELTCGNYAIQALTYHSFFYASYLIAKRLLSCNPLI